MSSPKGLKRRRRFSASQPSADDSQLEVLEGLRIMEVLGTARPTKFDGIIQFDSPWIDALNWISLLLETDTSMVADIAVAFSVGDGRTTIHLAKANGQPPTNAESGCLAAFLRTLRLSFKENNLTLTESIRRRMTDMMSEMTLPEIYRKLSRIGTVQGGTQDENWDRFLRVILPIFQEGHPRGEESSGFCELAEQIHGLAFHSGHYSSAVMVETMKSFVLHDQCKPLDKLSVEERRRFTAVVMRLSDFMIHSTFFDAVLDSDGHLRNQLDHEDFMFVIEMCRRVHDIGRYALGLSSFAEVVMPYIAGKLGKEGIAQFLNETGGIAVQWVLRPLRSPTQVPRALYWPTSPSDKVREVMNQINFALELEPLHLDRMALRDEVTALWTEGSPVAPALHSELQLIRYLDSHNISVVGNVIGMNRPPCWACYSYLRILYRGEWGQRWSMSYSTGRPRGPWMIPPGCPVEVVDTILRSMQTRIYEAIEEYGHECYGQVL
ncbi:hypothetical protein DXG03_002418 [Asterophora parasitica]|uniref:Uncharacterized protein n=1 Tax=Asterophora parasitica TaxID=117018 RepID=A0A9P7KCD5_9AGAR|nr:hypothetical protein DXG03_002418 [Asterophora parasitica]